MNEPVISFKDFHFRYKSQNQPTLKNINLTIYRGEKVLILGPSGSGKSTLGSCINGLIPHSFHGEITGDVQVCGLHPKQASLFMLAKHVGTVLQDTDSQFVGLSVGEDIAFSLENQNTPYQKMHQMVYDAAKVVGMETFLEENPYFLSGGQKQKVALAGVLHHDVDILLFDEPLAALDPAMGCHAVDLIDQIHRQQNKTIVIIEHRLEDILYRHVDRIILMKEGEIALDTTPQELLKSSYLKAYGIREPLYLAALKHAHIDVASIEHLDDVQQIDFQPYQKQLHDFYQNQPILSQKQVNKPLIRIEDVSFAYFEQNVLDHLNLTIYEGESICILGHNGAGKSTFAKLLCGMIRPDQGKVWLEDQDMQVLTLKQIGEMVGMVMQNPNQMLIKDMIAEEVKLAMQYRSYSKEEAEKRLMEVLKMCDLYGMRNWPISVLSYGQRKRVTIASILALRPKVLIVDEPTAGQDYAHYTEIMSFLNRLNQEYGITIIFITHDMHLALEYTKRAIVFHQGKIIGDDHVYAILTDPQLVENASLKMTSLSTLANQIDMDPQRLIAAFIQVEKKS